MNQLPKLLAGLCLAWILSGPAAAAPESHLPNFLDPNLHAKIDREGCWGIDKSRTEPSQIITACNGYLTFLEDDGPCNTRTVAQGCTHKQAMERDIHAINTLFYRANAHRAGKDFGAALDDYTRAIDTMNQRIASYMEKNRVPSQSVKYIDALLERARTHIHLQSYVPATADLDRLIGIWPQHPLAYFEKARVFAVQENYREAVALLGQAIDRDPRFALAYYHRAFSHHKLGNRKQAAADCTKANELDTRLTCK